jgi:hypothetical protein
MRVWMEQTPVSKILYRFIYIVCVASDRKSLFVFISFSSVLHLCAHTPTSHTDDIQSTIDPKVVDVYTQ